MLRMKITINTVAIFTTVKGKCQEFNSIYCNSASKHHNLSYRHSKKIESGGHFDSQDPSTAMRGSTETPAPRTVPCPSTPRPSRWRSRPAARPGPVCRPGASGWCRAPPGPQTSGACSSWGGRSCVKGKSDPWRQRDRRCWRQLEGEGPGAKHESPKNPKGT